jgi:hypothetical protein
MVKNESEIKKTVQITLNGFFYLNFFEAMSIEKASK